MRERFTENAEKVLKLAKKAAKNNGNGYIGSEHLLLGLLEEGEGTAAILLKESGADTVKIRTLVANLITSEGDTLTEETDYTPRTEIILENAVHEADFFHMEKVGTEHLLLALLKDTECVATRLLHTMEIDIRKLDLSVLSAMGIEESMYKELAQKEKARRDGGATPVLDQYSRDLTEMAAEGELDPIVGRDAEIERILQILSRRTKNNPCLIGEPGVGKTAIAEGLAQRIVLGAVPPMLQNKRVVTLDMASMVAGSKYRGEFEERIKKVIQEVTDSRDVLLFIDELHTIIGAGGAEGAMDASNILKPSLSRGEIQLIGATTIEEYRKYIEKDPALERRFQPVMVEEPSEEETLEILKGIRPYYEEHHGVRISDEALDAAVKLSRRYVNDRFLPDKAIDLMDEAASRKQLKGYQAPKQLEKLQQRLEQILKEKEESIVLGDFEEASNLGQEQIRVEEELKKEQKKMDRKRSGKKLTVGEEDVADVVAVWTKIPVSRLTEKESGRLLKLESTLHKRVVGQDEAVTAVAKAIKRGRVGLKDPKRPIGSFLFLGPTGVGKTELSKALAETVFGSEDAMIRVDMSEYMEKHSVSKLVGSPPGYVGYEEGGQLSEQVRRHPYSVILFDEIEKAHGDVFNILLQVLDDGQITDSNGRKADFKNTVIIMTSNAGAQRIMAPKNLGFITERSAKEDHERMKSHVMEEVKQIFKPEFINRVDGIMVFHTLEKPEQRKIVELLLKELSDRLSKNPGFTLEFSDKVADYVLEKGYDPQYGARPLRRAIQNELEDFLADEYLEGHIKNNDRILLDINDGKPVVKKAEKKKK